MIATETARRQILLGYAAALGAAASYGSLAVIGRKLVTDYASPVVVTAISMVMGTMILGAMFHRHVATDAVGAPKRAWLWVTLAGISATWGVGFWYFALSRAPVVIVAPVAGTHPLVSIVAAHLFLRRLERVTRRTVAGAALVVIGVALIAMGRG